jgi:hypothetical protein
MQQIKDTLLFTELTAQESASVNGACYRRRYYSSRYDSYRPRRHIVYRRNCNGTLRAVVSYW